MTSTKKIGFLSLVALALGASAGALGYAFGRDLLEPPEWTRSVRKMLGWTPPGGGATGGADEHVGRERTLRFGSIFVPLEAEVGRVHVDRDGTGGGLTSFGPAVLLVTHEGRIFSATSAGDIRETAIRAPDNGFSSYLEEGEHGRFSHLTHTFEKVRYNDILHFRSPEAHGLALSYTEYDDERGCYGTTIAVLRLPGDVQDAREISADPDDWEILHRTRPCLPLKEEWRAIEGHMAGGRIAFAPPSTLYLASGDYAWDGVYAPEALAQEIDNDYGKVLALDVRSGDVRVVSRGHRNMQGIALDAEGSLWVVEHGARGGDELNRIVEGGNYGWPEEALGVQYSGLPFPGVRSYGRHDLHTPPVFAWLPSVAISSLTLLDGFDPSWDGDLLMATLRSESLVRIRIRDGRVLFAERIGVGDRIRYALQHTDGRLVLWTDDHELLFVRPAERSFVASFVEEWLSGLDERGNDVRAALESCLECHSLEPGVNDKAPSLYATFGAPVGSTEYGAYSDALRTMNGSWTRDRLLAYLDDPQRVAPGTSMPDPGLADPFITAAIVDLLEAIRAKVE